MPTTYTSIGGETPKGKRYVKLTLAEIRVIQEFWRESSALSEKYLQLLHDVLERANAAELPLRQPCDWIQDQMVAATRGTLRQAMTNYQLMQGDYGREGKRECGVQLDAKEVKKSVQAMMRDIRNSLDLE